MVVQVNQLAIHHTMAHSYFIDCTRNCNSSLEKLSDAKRVRFLQQQQIKIK